MATTTITNVSAKRHRCDDLKKMLEDRRCELAHEIRGKLRDARTGTTDGGVLDGAPSRPLSAHNDGRAMIALKRAYDPVSHSDGVRVLVERLWPRRVSKAKLRIDGCSFPVTTLKGLRSNVRGAKGSRERALDERSADRVVQALSG